DNGPCRRRYSDALAPYGRDRVIVVCRVHEDAGGPPQPTVPASHEHVHRVGNVVTEIVQDKCTLMGNDGLVRSDGEPSLADVVMLANWKTTKAVKTAADALEPAAADMMIEELATDAVCAGLVGGEVTALLVGLCLQSQNVRHTSSIA